MKTKRLAIGIGFAILLSLSMCNSVLAAPIHQDSRMPSYLVANIGEGVTTIVVPVGREVGIGGMLSYGYASMHDNDHVITNETIYIQQHTQDGWLTVATTMSQQYYDSHTAQPSFDIWFALTPQAAGTFDYRLAFLGDDLYLPSVSNTFTLIVNPVVVSQ